MFAARQPGFESLPIRQLHNVEDYISARLAEEISVETLARPGRAGPVPLARQGFWSFLRVFKQTTGLSPLQFVTRERITRPGR